MEKQDGLKKPSKSINQVITIVSSNGIELISGKESGKNCRPTNWIDQEWANTIFCGRLYSWTKPLRGNN